jgi:fumarylacetoacetate (FAA) hydrolase
MRLATLKDGSRDGALAVVARSGASYASARAIAPNLQAALDDWPNLEPRLRELAAMLERGIGAEPLRVEALLAPLPRAYEWIDGSAFINHVSLVRRARGADLPATLLVEPLVYQGGSGVLLAATEPFVLPNPEWGLDFEGELSVVVGVVAQGASSTHADDGIRLLMLANDWTYRELVSAELTKGFGFFNSKPATAFSPFAVTPDELGARWREGRLSLCLQVELNGQVLGAPNAGEGMHFSFIDLITHAAKTRALTAGTIVGSGTISNEADEAGVACIVERRTRQVLQGNAASMPYLAVGDRVVMRMLDDAGWNVFGTIDQTVTTGVLP